MENEELLNDFKSMLEQQGYSHHTIRWYGNCLKAYFKWLSKQGLSPFDASYETLLNYVKVGKDSGNKVKTINSKLISIKTFYRSLLGVDNSINQPYLVKITHDIDGLKIRGGIRFPLYEHLSEDQLTAIYNDCPTDTMNEVRNKCVLGMMIYQALGSGQIERLQVQDLQLEQGKVYIKGTRRNNERTLQLHPNQIFLLQKYVLGIRPALLRYTNVGESNKLFCNQNGSEVHLRNSLMYTVSKVKKLHPKLEGLRQIHRSVIHQWIKKDNIRVVQYRLGHRYLSSTQMYLEGDIESLQQQIDRLHPLNDQSNQ